MAGLERQLYVGFKEQKELGTDFLHNAATNLSRPAASTRFGGIYEETPAVGCTAQAAISMSSAVNEAVLHSNL